MKFLILLIPLFLMGCGAKSGYVKVGEGGSASCTASVITGVADCMMQGPVEYHTISDNAPEYLHKGDNMDPEPVKDPVTETVE